MSEDTKTRKHRTVEEATEAERLYEQARTLADDPEKQTEVYRQAAELGHPQAQTVMWKRADEGIGMPVDHEEATAWLTLAADYFHAYKVDLARRYFDGIYVRIDAAKGNELLKQAVEHKVVEALCELGVSHLRGRGLPSDVKMATEYFNAAIKEATHNGQEYRAASAYYCLGTCHEEGFGRMKKDPDEAFRMYLRSADLGNAEGMKKLFMYARVALTDPERLPPAAIPVLYRRLLAPKRECA